ncbi:hypothetical protein T01_11066 [Trichinella spiralis]|uniref:Uncharacterized protein n=1 Tax=Trichinella spiralis TaxID=6334 RepID=A0A0V0YQE1_TRISP|nr:hypothetical protein T01_11066 [Trichinella spiralis]
MAFPYRGVLPPPSDVSQNHFTEMPKNVMLKKQTLIGWG